MSDSNAYHFYWSGPFSQWHPSQFTLDGVRYDTAEMAMMHKKALLFGDSKIAQEILVAQTPDKQKALGRQVSGFDLSIWEANREQIIADINFAKFDQNKGLRRKLFQTGDKQLAEASPVDTIWGIGLSKDQASLTPVAQWPGQNLLGRIVTTVREQLKTKYPQESASVELIEDTI